MVATIVIIAVLAIVIVYGFKSSVKHVKGGCCGGGEDVKLEKKKLTGEVIETKRMQIEGMTCDNCRKRVENELNEMDGVFAKVNLKAKSADIQLTRHVEDAELRRAVEHINYKVAGIETV